MPSTRLPIVSHFIDRADIVLIYPAREAPHYRIGYKAALAFGIACLVFVTVFAYQDRRLRRMGATSVGPRA